MRIDCNVRPETADAHVWERRAENKPASWCVLVVLQSCFLHLSAVDDSLKDQTYKLGRGEILRGNRVLGYEQLRRSFCVIVS